MSQNPNSPFYINPNHLIEEGEVFVIGSNKAGIHGAGLALTAVKEHGAIYGKGVGMQGNTYAIPTKDENIKSMKLEEIKNYVKDFIDFAKNNLDKKFFVPRIGCGRAGFTDSQIAPLFKDAPNNCRLPPEWIVIIKNQL